MANDPRQTLKNVVDSDGSAAFVNGADNPALLMEAGLACLRRGALDEAESLFRKVLSAAPDHAESLRLLAITQFDAGHYADSVRSFEVMHEKHGVDMTLIEPFAFALCAIDRAGEASDFLDWAMTVWPDHIPIIRAKAYQCFCQSQHLQGVLFATQLPWEALRTQEVGVRLVGALAELGNFDFALRALDAIFPDDCRANSYEYSALRGVIAMLSADHETAESWFVRAGAIHEPDSIQEYSYFHVLAMLGKYPEAWEHFHRREPGYKRGRIADIPEWTGQPLQGATIVVHAEQGIGDNIQFMRFLPELEKRGARVVYSTYPALMELLSMISSGPVAIDEEEILSADYQTSPMDLPGYLCLPTLPAERDGAFYLASPESKRKQWRESLGPSTSCRVGVVWAGNPKFANDHNRSASLDDFIPLAAVPGIEWYSLQLGDASREVAAASFPKTIIDLSSGIADLGDTAGILENLDLLISIDTSVAHLAGALGRPVWLLHSKYGDWRWGLRGETTPWYPTMRVFRQNNNWKDLLREAVRPALAEFAESKLARSRPDSQRGFEWLRGLPVVENQLRPWCDQVRASRSYDDALVMARDLAIDHGEPGPLEYLADAVDGDHSRIAHSYLAEWLVSRNEHRAAVARWESLADSKHPLPLSSSLARARAYRALGQTDSAKTCLEGALRSSAASPLLTEYAASLYDQGARLEDVESSLKKALDSQRRNVMAHWLAAEISVERANVADATEHYATALRIMFGVRGWWDRFAHAAAKLGYPNYSANSLEITKLSIAPLTQQLEQLPVVVRLGNYPMVSEILERLRKLELDSLSSRQVNRLAYAVSMARSHEEYFEAIASWLRTRPLPFGSSDERNISLTVAGHLLRKQEFASAWIHVCNGLRTVLDFGCPDLDDADTTGKRILVYQDQGFGDCIQYLPAIFQLAQRNDVVLAVIEPLHSLLAAQGYPFKIIRIGEVDSYREFFDVQCRLMSLVALLQLDLSKPTQPVPYIKCVGSYPDILERVRPYADKLKVGLVWAGNRQHLNDVLRSTRLKDWDELFTMRNVQIFSLQKDVASQQLIAYPSGINLADAFDDFSGAAAAVAAMDIIVGVDTGLLHLAGAMGKPAWMVLPYYGQDGRWFEEGDRYPWYPTLRLLRREPADSWQDAIHRMVGELSETRAPCELSTSVSLGDVSTQD